MIFRHIIHYSATTLTLFFFFNDTAPPEIYTLSLHDALPICDCAHAHFTDQLDADAGRGIAVFQVVDELLQVFYRINIDRKSTRLNSSHSQISYAVFCLKKKK